MSYKEALGTYWFPSVNFGALMPWTLGEEGGVYVSSRKSIFIAEGAEQDKGRRQAEKERRRKEEREEYHISPVWSCAFAGHHTHSKLLTSLMPTHHWQPVAAFAYPGFDSLHHWIHFRDVLIPFPVRGSLLLPFFLLQCKASQITTCLS